MEASKKLVYVKPVRVTLGSIQATQAKAVVAKSPVKPSF